MLHTTRLASLFMVGTTSPHWQSSPTSPRDVADGSGQYSPGVSLSNVNTTTPGTVAVVLNLSDTWRVMLCTMCHPQYEHMPAPGLRNRRLHSRRSNSRSVCRLVILDNRDWGHTRRKSHISAVETAGPVMFVISWSVMSWKP